MLGEVISKSNPPASFHQETIRQELIMSKKLIYGATTLYKVVCKNCGETMLKGSLKSKCDYCGENIQREKINNTEIILEPKRGKYSRKFKKRILENQNGRCYWCNRYIGSYVVRKGKSVQLFMHAEHKKPFIKFCNNENDNVVISCHLCNLFKSSTTFGTDEDCREYLNNKWLYELNNGIIHEL
jgi:hypothetical protein